MTARSKLGLIALSGVIALGALLVLRRNVPLPDEKRVMNDVLSSSPQFTTSSGDCGRILQSEPWCSVIQDVRQITRPEWVELFPQAKFFLAAAKSVGGETSTTHNLLVIEQNGQRYQAETFDSLLEANQIVITDQNRELVAKAFALITLKDYLASNFGGGSRSKTIN